MAGLPPKCEERQPQTEAADGVIGTPQGVAREATHAVKRAALPTITLSSFSGFNGNGTEPGNSTNSGGKCTGDESCRPFLSCLELVP